MRSIKSSILKKINKMRKRGISYSEISKKIGISKSSAHKYTKSITLNDVSRRKISIKIKNNQKKFVEKYAKTKKLPRRINWNINKARLISHSIFDGSVTDFVANYTSSSKKLIDQFVNDIKIVYGLKYTNIYTSKGKKLNKYTVSYCSKELCKDLKKYTNSYNSTSNQTKIPKEVFSSKQELIGEFLRAFWEDEGCITIRGEILSRIKNRNLRDQLLKLHKIMNIECSSYNCSDGAFGIRIKINKKNLNMFKVISFKHAPIVRGFNKGMKKKDLLERIYKSYLDGPVV